MLKRPDPTLTLLESNAVARSVLGRTLLGIKIPENERKSAEAEIQQQIASVDALLAELQAEAQGRAKKP